MRREGRDLQQLGMQYFNTRTHENYIILYNELKPRFQFFINKYYNAANELSHMDVEDCVSDALLKIFINIDSYNEYFKFSTWSYTIAKNEALIKLSKKKKYKEVSMNNGELTHTAGSSDSSQSQAKMFIESSVKDQYIDNPDADKQIKNDALRYLIRSVIKEIRELDDRYKGIIWDREVHKMSYKDLAEKYKLDMPKCKIYIHKGRRILKNRLQHLYDEWKSI
jgi:RNA polymerase sigma-70 factor (ECF subfamily)